MKELLDKISSYNLFNYLLPGIVFVSILEKLKGYSLVQDNLVLGVFVYYFIGLVISRVGSVVIEPLLKKTEFVKFADYKDFVATEKVDPKLETLSEANNMYRTFIAMFCLLILVKLYERSAIEFPFLDGIVAYTVIVGLLIMFLFAYRKQTSYITKRCQITKK